MRALVLALALLAGLKIWIQESAYRSATEDALMLAYRAKAADACRQHETSSAGSEQAIDWSSAAARLAIGNPAVSVHIWDFDNALWNARYRQPYMVLSATEASRSCAYDILGGTAEVSRT